MERNNAHITKGSLLIADPILDEAYFKRGVILLSNHSDDGTVGFVLNKEISNMRITDLVDGFDGFDFPVFLGGPVCKDNLYYVHTAGNLLKGSSPITNKLYLGGHFDSLKELIKKGEIKENEVRFFVGYSGWAPGQLEKEIKSESWFIGNIKPKYVFEQNTKLWHDVLTDLGNDYQLIANFPEDPSMN